MCLTLVLLAAGFCVQLWSVLASALPDSTKWYGGSTNKGEFLNQRLGGRCYVSGGDTGETVKAQEATIPAIRDNKWRSGVFLVQ